MADITLTEEQYAPLQSSSRKIVVKALAGTGKSTLLRAYSFFNPQERILYLVFNADNSAAAKKTFPKANVKVSTFHAYAYESFGYEYQRAGKIRGITSKAIKDHAGVNDWKIATIIRDVITNYLNSADLIISETHLPKDLGSFYFKMTKALVRQAQDVWSKVVDLNSSMPCSHDAYLKIWANSSPELPFDTIMLDEAQDSNELMMSVIKNQKAKIILVGDRNQQLYAFRGSVNILDNEFLRDAAIYPLTQSFRFGTSIAKVANILLSLASEKLRVRGLDAIPSKVMNMDDDELGHHGKPYQKAYISRTVSGTIEVALALAGDSKKTYWGGKVSSYNLDDLKDLYFLSVNQTESIKNQFIKRDYSSFSNYKEIAEQTSDAEMMRNVKIVEKYGPNLPSHIESLKRHATENQHEAEYIVTTAHRSKGLEFECVTLSDDFTNPMLSLSKSIKEKGHITEDAKRAYLSEMFLLYVAVTRAIHRLNINKVVAELIEDAKRRANRGVK